VAIVVSVVVVVGLIVVAWAVVVLFRRLLWPGGEDGAAETLPPSPRPYGGLTEPGPVGELGQLSPDADLSQSGSDSHDLYGE
jgi:hypothetical protein